jgi:hypothetical protein
VAAKAKKSGGRSELEHASPILSQGGPSGHALAGDESPISQWLKMHDSGFPLTSLDVA